MDNVTQFIDIQMQTKIHKCMTDYDQSNERSYMIYWEVKNLLISWEMLQNLPAGSLD